MPKRKLSPVIYKKTKNFKKFIEKTKQIRLQTKAATGTSTDNKTSPSPSPSSSATPMTNDECKRAVKHREELQINDNGCDYFKVMNTKETTMSTTCDDNVKDENDDDNDKQSVANKKCCYASISANKSQSIGNGNGKVDNFNACVVVADDDDGLNDADDCCDDTNNHSNNNGNNKTTRVINDNNTNVASNENNSNRSNTKSYGKLNGNNSNSNNSNNDEEKQQHHKLSNKTNDTDGNHDDDNNDAVDNCNVDNVKYNKHHKTSKILQTTATATPTTHDSSLIQSTTHMPLHMKQQHTNEISSLPTTMSSLTSTVNSSSTWPTTMTTTTATAIWHESCEHHKIKNCETVHHQPPQSSTHENGHIPNSIVQQLDTFVSNYKVKINYDDQNSTGHRESTSATTTTTMNSLSKCELASPRCQSRESTASASANNDVRCPSNESHYSGHDGHTTPAQTPTPTTPPVGLPLPATLAPAAAAALLPPQSAAMAAYFNAAAAAAAQQNHLLLTNPLAAAASLVQQATQQAAHSPNTSQTLTPTPSNRTDLVDASALDFSTKRSRRHSDDDDANGGSEDEEDGGDDGERNDNEADNVNDNEAEDLNSPLDLSVNNGRKRQSDEEEPVLISNRKLARSNDYKSLPASSTWVPPINPYLAAVAAANMSPKTSLSMDWNTKAKIAPNEATKALEKMTEMTRLGGSSKSDHTEASNRNTSSSSSSLSTTTTSTTSNGRHSAWQSHWLNKGADAVKDVFKCVWCKQSFATLASLTTHMKETQHCGVNVPPSVTTNSGTSSNSGGNQTTTQSSHHSRHSTTQSNATASAQIAANNAATSVGGSKSDLNMLIKETMPLPRKLVRGQDVWLGKGAEQTRQILKCMWCGQSFRSLAEMTSHMQETQHYTNIISQEQIISWKSSDEKTSRDNSSSSSSGNRGLPANTAAITTSNTVPENDGNNSVSPNSHTVNANSTVSAVLTCKVCDQAFSTLKELSNHMVKNNHYKEHMIRTATVPENVPTMIRGRGRQTREKRKKSLPVRKLLEMERAQHDFKSAGLDQALKPLRDFAISTKLACETCGDKVETAMFVDHIRQCIDKSLILSPRSQNNNNNNNTIKTPYGPSTPQERLNSPQTPHSRSDGRKTSDGNMSPLSTTTNTRADILCPLPPDADKTTSSTSVLSALEQLIEKSFDSRPRHSSNYGDGSSAGTPLGSSILKRLGIDDNIDYTKPLMDQQTMQFLRSYSNYPSNRDRSASESSSVSERCSSRLESFTPDRCHDLSRQPTPRLTPDKSVQMPKETRDAMYGTKIKSEPIDNSHQQIPDNDNTAIHEMPKKISVKKEFNIPEEQEDYEHNKMKEASDMRLSSLTPSSRAISPSISERSITPKSTCSAGEKKSCTLGLTESSSLNALSSMFNNLNNMTNTTLSSSANIETNNNNTAPMMPKKMNANPLAALQKLCDTTDTPAANTRSSSANHNVLTHSNTAVSSSSNVSGGSGGGVGASNASMLAFSWACNDAVVTADSIIKCSFCDTPFSSKGAYRHHLSKVHFVKDDHGHEMNNMKSPASLAAISPKSLTSPKSVTSSKSPAVQQQRLEATPPSSVATTPTINPYDESPQSKFLKYTELAKQLSSKNA